MISSMEFKKNFDKYNKLAQREEIIITNHGKPVYTLQPIQIKKLKDMESLFGILPSEATIGIGLDERG